jgi:hypothetical protein
MKKLNLVILALFFASIAIHAQGIGIGIKAGANFADQAVEDIDVNTVTNFHVGAFLNLNLSKNFGITPEVLYTAYGTKWEDVKVNYDYIAIPVMLRFIPVEILSIEAGPQFSFLTKAEVEGVGDVKDQLKNNDFGLGFGAGLHLPIGLMIGTRYILGFTNISDVSDESVQNRTLQIYAGWTFGAK